MMCKHGKNIGNTQEIQLSREGGRTWAPMGKKLWAKVIPYYDKRSGFDYKDQEGFYSAEGCNQHPWTACHPGDREPEIEAYDADELRLQTSTGLMRQVAVEKTSRGKDKQRWKATLI